MRIESVVIIMVGLLSSQAIAEKSWTVDPTQGTLTFTVDIGGAVAQGEFGEWTAEIIFFPKSPSDGAVTVTVDVASVTIDDARAQAIAEEGWLGVGAYPIAIFTSESFDPSNEAQLTVPGTLTLKDISAPMELFGTLVVDNCMAEATATGPLDRTQHDIGAGQSAVEPIVNITATLIAHCD
ncbi:YceI family protein [Ruegeria arenilitoris]|uniref:YceI family protein n=1 Tax=Ruegeria arenilitoris TaxID=1173585 RepID=UPI0014814F05|nr:YceI family protein [Ruegeria arenilitoris]